MPPARGTCVKRRTFIAGLAATAAGARLTQAQPASKVPVIGFLHPGLRESGSPVFDALRESLRDAGFAREDSVRIEARWARGNPEALPQLAQELVQLGAVVLVATARA